MITIDQYIQLISKELKIDVRGNPSQANAIEHSGNDILQLVAGPGSGKTTVLVLRALRHVLVDGIMPEDLLITTFTRKAAKELRTRWLEYGSVLLDSLLLDSRYSQRIANTDINRCRIDTLDSIIQQALTENRLPGETAPNVVPEATAKLLFKKHAFGIVYWANGNKQVINDFCKKISFNQNAVSHYSEALNITKSLFCRLIHDRVDMDRYRKGSHAQSLIVDIAEQYKKEMGDKAIYDFSLLESTFLERLQGQHLEEWIHSIKVLLVDEYQDTNPLQESIYFEIVNQANPHVSIVGDDDQSMYRFRGGSVELFTQFKSRCLAKIGRSTSRIDLVTNYRSTNEIVSFYNSYISNDPMFSNARVSPPKPPVISIKGAGNMPVIGMFRQTKEELADSLADWILTLFHNKRYQNNGVDISVSSEGNFGDCVFLSHSVNERKFDRFDSAPDMRFTGLFRESMESRGLSVFNPRGNSLRHIPDVSKLLGLILECIDPDDIHVSDCKPSGEERHFISSWREEAKQFAKTNPHPNDNNGIMKFIRDWKLASRGNPPSHWPDDWPILELVFRLICWIPKFQTNPEHQVWLEAITRTFSSVGIASPYGMMIKKSTPHCDYSRRSIIRDALFSIAGNEVEVDEDIMPSIPRDWFPMMTIHQAKGLEFPLVIVDVGSHFSINHHLQRFLRFPSSPSNTVEMEDNVEPYLKSPLRSMRLSIDRTFDDLVRLYYVSYSRPKQVLLLVGNEKCLKYGNRNGSGAIPNIALSWRRNGDWPWRHTYSGKKPPVLVTPPHNSYLKEQ